MVHPRFRILRGETIAMGPGKAELLQAVQQHGSIREAATSLGMSYMRAWSLIRTMNSCFRSPLVVTLRGGGQKGGARLTKTGEKVLSLYERIQDKAIKSTAVLWRQILKELK